MGLKVGRYQLSKWKGECGYKLSFFTVGVTKWKAYTKRLGSCDEWRVLVTGGGRFGYRKWGRGS